MAQCGGYGGYRKINNQIKQHRALLLLGWVTAEQSCLASSPPARPLVVVRKTPSSLLWRMTVGVGGTPKRDSYTASLDLRAEAGSELVSLLPRGRD
ncbi:hypothetical protein J6590_050750 [Homalodisca vitripennis]|nr:hypothetical protein J6590_100542 [Homalodisca vitripennis]KAG8296731.1 hypothetical protein J6590_050750 [Homalodisca vitripennis]